MSFPEDLDHPQPRYHADRGEVNALHRPADTPADIAGTSTTHHLATHETTGGEFGLYKVELGAWSGGAGTHFHRAMSESFYVLSGQGDFLYVPVGGPHAFRNTADEPLSMED
ncbi:hypothetical protein ABZ896_08925 [Streptomyces sp. NPDC047072]|uniref:hypothetical protein n=1 Tax=Streptomyces sp. NPDC047072 TaxID=3154809 RepID=UPI0034108E2B